jgi:hypothetical protein
MSRRFTFAWAWTVAVVLAAPAAADWRQNAATATWFFRAPVGSARCATAAEVPAAIAHFTERSENAWQGLTVASAAIEFDADLAGECELRIVSPRAEATAFVDAWAPRCGAQDGASLAERSAAVDGCIKESLRSLVRRYREASREPIQEPEIP